MRPPHHRGRGPGEHPLRVVRRPCRRPGVLREEPGEDGPTPPLLGRREGHPRGVRRRRTRRAPRPTRTPRRTEHTITDREAFEDELERIRERGYSTNDEEDLLGVRAVGTSILGPDGDVLGALSVSAPASRLDGERFDDEFPRKVTETVNIVEVNLQTMNGDA
ncbi:IclR family transcriptional regulator domain-containing protein [Halospeciosus flavus]|uniref:IclR family transcriptional regulator domain-containing protein n=1 Tax=Halospeciosus flavus TaxID=3032283 RepID=UPI003610488A